MGGWGTGIFEDDTACDIRDEYLAALASGASDRVARQRVIELIAEDADDEDYAPIVWMAFAAIQWECGRLDNDVKVKALHYIDAGDSPLWQAEEDLVEERNAVTAALRARLCSPQPARRDRQAITAFQRELYGDAFVDSVQRTQTKKWWEFWKS